MSEKPRTGMLQLKKHHLFILGAIIVFATAWAIWTFFWIPQTVPRLDPAAQVPAAQH